jgi:8-oxo-dGTP pyrophosphatase MutT (NUDIX family)
MNESIYCNNCGKGGHMFHQCKIPITSIGIIVFRKVEGVIQYLMIRRKDTLGHIDFMRGKYSIYNKHYLINMLNQMTVAEKERMKLGDFDLLWRHLWLNNTLDTTIKGAVDDPKESEESSTASSALLNQIPSQYKCEEHSSRDKYNSLLLGVSTQTNFYRLCDLIEESNQYTQWTEAEWGFPKGRRNPQEKDFQCAIREFEEETGYPAHLLKNIQNILPFEEIFTGSNYKSYKHKYYLMYMPCIVDSAFPKTYDTTEISKMEWKTYDECLEVIRPYNNEKKNIITRIHSCLQQHPLFVI